MSLRKFVIAVCSSVVVALFVRRACNASDGSIRVLASVMALVFFCYVETTA